MTDCRAVGVGCGLKGLGDSVCMAVDDAGNCTQYAAAATPTAMPAASTGFNWDSWVASLVGGAAKTAETVITAKNQTKGVYTQTSPTGTVTYVQPEGNTSNIFGASSTGITGTATTSSSMGMILIGGAALLLVFMLAKGKG